MTATNKIVGFRVMTSDCRTCSAAAKKNVPPTPHDCRKNWAGSAKAMEPAMAVEILSNIKEKGHAVKKLVMDDDATTIAKVRNELDANIEKGSDRNHTIKNFTNSLYALQKEKKLQRVFSTKTINHVKKCFAIAIAKNKNNSTELKQNLLAIPGHLFGNHNNCTIAWCNYLKDPENYVPKYLPYCKYLSNQDLYHGLSSIFSVYADKSDRLSTLGSTQSNESFNSMVSLKNPKNKFYSGSESTSTRVAAAVCQKNLGEHYLLEVPVTFFSYELYIYTCMFPTFSL
jgi:hypothetical protein